MSLRYRWLMVVSGYSESLLVLSVTERSWVTACKGWSSRGQNDTFEGQDGLVIRRLSPHGYIGVLCTILGGRHMWVWIATVPLLPKGELMVNNWVSDITYAHPNTCMPRNDFSLCFSHDIFEKGSLMESGYSLLSPTPWPPKEHFIVFSETLWANNR